MTQEQLYAKTLGFYEPSLFHIHLAYDVKLDEWKNWPDEVLFTFFHEYIHFLQDLTTTSGLYNIFVLDEWVNDPLADDVQCLDIEGSSCRRPSDDQIWLKIKDKTGVTNSTSF